MYPLVYILGVSYPQEVLWPFFFWLIHGGSRGWFDGSPANMSDAVPGACSDEAVGGGVKADAVGGAEGARIGGGLPAVESPFTFLY